MLKRNRVAVLEIGTGKIILTAIGLDKNGKVSLCGKSRREFSGYYGERFLDDVSVLSEEIKKAAEEVQAVSGEKIKEVFVGAPAAFCAHIIRDMSYRFGGRKKITFDDIKKVSEMASVIEGSERYTLIESAAVSYILGEGGETSNCIGVTASEIRCRFSLIYMDNSFKAFADKALKDCGIKKVTYISECASEARYYFDGEEVGGTPVLLDTGMIGSQYAASYGRGFSVMGYIPVGGAHISGDLSEKLDMEFSSAELLKKRINLNLHPLSKDFYPAEGGDVPVDNCNDIVRKRLDGFSAKLVKELEKGRGYENNTKVYLTGGGFGYIKGADKVLEEGIGLEVRPVGEAFTGKAKAEEGASAGLVKEAARRLIYESEGIYRFE